MNRFILIPALIFSQAVFAHDVRTSITNHAAFANQSTCYESTHYADIQNQTNVYQTYEVRYNFGVENMRHAPQFYQVYSLAPGEHIVVSKNLTVCGTFSNPGTYVGNAHSQVSGESSATKDFTAYLTVY